MKKSNMLVITLFSIFLFTLGVEVVQASPLWDSIQSGYAVTTNRFGEEVNVGVDEVIAMAGTTDTNVEAVEFRWFPPGQSDPIWPETVYTWTTDSWKGINFRRYDSSPHILTTVGDWSVQVFFKGPGGQLRHTSDIIAIRARTVMAVPEVPIGALTAMLSMLTALAIFTLKRKGI